MKNKQILFVSKDAHWQRYRNEVLAELTRLYDCEVTVITCLDVEEYIKETSGLRYIVSSNLLSFSSKLNLIPYVYFYILKRKPDAVLALPNVSNFTELTLSVFCKLTKSNLTYWTHGYDHCRRPTEGIRGQLNRFRVKIIETCLSLADNIIVFSPKGKEYLEEKKVTKKEIIVAPNTLNTNKLLKGYHDVDLNDVSEFKKKHGLEDTTIFLFSGRLRAGKRLERFIEAAGSAKNLDKISLVVVGDGEMKDEWMSMCEDVGLKSVFLGEVFEDKRLSIIFKSSDWFVMPGYVGLAIVHAFSHGLPILTENISFHSPEIYYLENEKNGFIFEEGGVNEWKYFIENSACDPYLKNKVSTNAISTVNAKASIGKQLASMAKALGVSARV
ncbi:glycosyltransferase family 4 protein [Vibrio sp. NH-7]